MQSAITASQPASFQAWHFKLKERHIANKHKRRKNPNGLEAEQLVIYKHDRGVELGSTEKQLQLSAGSEPDFNSRPRISSSVP